MNTSATRWTYEVHQLSEDYSAIIYDANGYAVADHLKKEHADLIVRAVNAHDDLVEALSKTIIAIDAYAAVSGKSDIGLVTAVRDAKATLNSARAALAKASGEQP